MRKKFGLVLQGAAALGAYEVGAIEYLYESGMECAIVSGASSGAMNAATLAGAKGYPPQVLRGGHVADHLAFGDDVAAIRSVNDAIAADPRVKVVLIPLGDGVSFVQKLGERQ